METGYIITLIIILIGAILGAFVDMTLGKCVVALGIAFCFCWFLYTTTTIAVEQLTAEWESAWAVINY